MSESKEKSLCYYNDCDILATVWFKLWAKCKKWRLETLLYNNLIKECIICANAPHLWQFTHECIERRLKDQIGRNFGLVEVISTPVHDVSVSKGRCVNKPLISLFKAHIKITINNNFGSLRINWFFNCYKFEIRRINNCLQIPLQRYPHLRLKEWEGNLKDLLHLRRRPSNRS